MQPNGYVIYDGPSAWDGKRIVVIVTGIRSKSANRKTGGMVQTYIIRPDVSPLAAVYESEADASICGDCPHRGIMVDVARPVLASPVDGLVGRDGLALAVALVRDLLLGNAVVVEILRDVLRAGGREPVAVGVLRKTVGVPADLDDERGRRPDKERVESALGDAVLGRHLNVLVRRKIVECKAQ